MEKQVKQRTQNEFRELIKEHVTALSDLAHKNGFTMVFSITDERYVQSNGVGHTQVMLDLIMDLLSSITTDRK